MLNQRNARFLFFFVGFFVFISAGCVRDLIDTADELGDIKSVKWNPVLAIPLVKTELTPDDLLKQYNIDVVRTDDEDLLHFIYESKFISVQADEIFSIPDQNNNFSFILGPIGATALQNSGSYTATIPITIDFTIADIEIDSMILKTCDQILQMTSSIQHDIAVVARFPDIFRNGTPYSISFNSPYSGSAHNVARNASLAGAKFICTNGPQGYNQIRINLDLTFTKRGSNPINSTDMVAFTNQFNNNQFRVFWGLGKTSTLFQTNDSIEITIFSNRTQGSFSVVNPRFVVKFANSFGAKINGDINNLYTWNPQIGDEVLTGIPSPLPIPSPTNAQMGMILYDSFVLDNNNSNITSVINNLPHGVYYDFNAIINPPGNSNRNFVLDTSRFETDVYVDIPLNGTASDFVLERIQDFELDIDSTIDKVEYALFRINVDNGFPVDLGFQLYFEKDDGTLIDTMFEDQLTIESGELDANGKVIRAVNTIEDVKVTNEKYERLKTATKMRVRARLDTRTDGGGNQDPVKFYSEYRMGLKIGVQTKLSIISN